MIVIVLSSELMREPIDYFIIGFFVLMFAFVFSVLSINMFADLRHVVIALDPNPRPNNLDFNQQNYDGFLIGLLLYGIVPVSSALVFLTIACAKARKIPTKEFRNLAWFIFASVFMAFGFLISINSYRIYLYMSDLASRWQITHIDYALQTICATFGLVGVLWILTGVVFIAIFRIGRLNHKVAQEENPRAM